MHNTLRPAIAMIELIFTIVIMGIVMMSAPMLISTASNSGYTAMQQESINEAATQMNIIMGYQWDENNTQEEHTAVVLKVSSGDANLNENNTTRRRAGTPTESHRAYVSPDGGTFNATAIGDDGNETEKDDMDDFNGTTSRLRNVEQGDADYIDKNVMLSTTVAYMSDEKNGTSTYASPEGGVLEFIPTFAPVVGTTNIKRIQVTLITNSGVDELAKTIVLHAFSCNIGSYKLEEK